MFSFADDLLMISLWIFFRERTNQLYDKSLPSHSGGDANATAELDNAAERVPEDLAGRVCYELEPLVDSLWI